MIPGPSTRRRIGTVGRTACDDGPPNNAVALAARSPMSPFVGSVSFFRAARRAAIPVAMVIGLLSSNPSAASNSRLKLKFSSGS